ncbi:MAG: DUF5671 domain-containing protein [Patescibacteria group bacterium]
MENTTAPVTPLSGSKTTPKDFFLWLGAIIALYGAITSIITLLFEYVNYSFPDQLAGYGDPYGGSVRFAMASLIVLVPTTVVLFRIIRGTIIKESGKASIWVRRWALGLTLFIATITILIDLVYLINTFLGGEITTRFELKVLIILLVAAGVFMHFLADLRGYWIENVQKGNMVGVAVGVLAIATIVAGFFIVGSPSHVRDLRYDDQKVSDLQNIQYQLTNYFQQKRALPKTLDELNDPLTNTIVPVDGQTGTAYTYEVKTPLSFSLCATFNAPTPDTAGRGNYGKDVSYPQPIGPDPLNENWKHGVGETCFDRTIDPTKYPAVPAVKGL